MGEPSLRRRTPPGRAALASWRVSGDCGLTLVARDGAPRDWPAAGRVVVARLVGGGAVIDEAVVVGLDEGAHELHLHGGDGVAARLAAACASAGVVERLPEADAPTSLRAAVARASATAGVLRGLVDGLDAAPPDDPAVAARVARALALAPLAERLATPARIRLVGRPNAGKSTLFNALLGRRRALVSPVEGTTRDAVAAPWVLHGVPVVLEDTAGRDAGAAPDDGRADCRVHVVADDAAPAGTALVARTHADLRRGRPARVGVVDVSGTTGAGLDALREELAARLAIPADRDGDVWAPLDAADRARLQHWWAARRRGPG